MRKRRLAIITIILVISLICFLYIKKNVNILGLKINKKLMAEQSISYEEASEVGKNAVITSAIITNQITGTGPFDEETITDSKNSDGSITWTAGNDTSENDNIVRSFDEITWTLENTMNIKENIEGMQNIKGGVIEVKVTLPETCSNLVEWQLDKMVWAQNVEISSNQTTFTATYNMSESTITIPGKQNLQFTLKVFGAKNGLEIKPTFTVILQGNEESEKKNITTSSPIIVSSAPKYNVNIARSDCNKRTKLNYGEGEKEGRVIGYTIVLQLYNDTVEKGLKGVEYPDGDITFDLEMKMKRSDTGNDADYVDITDESLPILWSYKINFGNKTYKDRNMNFGDSSANNKYRPSGILNDVNNSVFNSGNVEMNQENKTIRVKINNYKFNGVFPKFNYEYTPGITKPVFSNNIGCFSSSYFQIFVPDTEANSIDTSKYKLTVSQNNLLITSGSGKTVNSQQVSEDDANEMLYQRIVKGSYSHHFDLLDSKGSYNTNRGRSGDTTYIRGENFIAIPYININPSTESCIYSLDELVKFNGEAFEPYLVNYNKNDSGVIYGKSGNMTFKYYYLTKKDGTNWESNSELNNENDMSNFKVYKSLEDIPEEHLCIGLFIMSAGENENEKLTAQYNGINIPMKVKNNAPVNQTYSIVHTTWIWEQYNKLDRNIYCVNEEDRTYETPPAAFIIKGTHRKSEYDENGTITTSQNSYTHGSTALVIDAREKVQVESFYEKEGKETARESFDLGKVENIVKYKITPTLEITKDEVKRSNITVNIKDILPKGLTYIEGSCNYGEPYSKEIDKEENTVLIWKINNCTTGEKIEPLKFNASIYEDTANNKTYENKVIISSDQIQSNIESKRTSTNSIKIINLASYILYNEAEKDFIEKGESAQINVVTTNKTDSKLNDFQLLDILPYNGDGRGTAFSGSYEIENIEIIQTNITTGQNIENNNLELYVTEDESVRNGVTAKDQNLGTNSIWQQITSSARAKETINAPIKAFALIGKLDAKVKVEIKIRLKIQENSQGDKYCNSATAQISKDTEALSSSVILIQSIKRDISGKIWFDKNKDGNMDIDEEPIEGIQVSLLDESEKEISTITTDANGEYAFGDLVAKNYKVQIKVTENTKEITKKGTDNKFNREDQKGTTDLIKDLNRTDVASINLENINAGIAYKDAKVIVHYYEEETGNKLAEDEEVKGKVNDEYKTSESKNIADYYELIEEPKNKNGTMTLDTIEVTYKYRLKEYNYTVNYYKDSISEENFLGKESNKLEYGKSFTADIKKYLPEGYKYEGATPQITISNQEANNIINIVYKKDIYVYKVEYYKDETKYDEKKNSAEYGTVITKAEIEESNQNNRPYGYEIDRINPETLTIGINENENIIKIYYKKMNSSAKIEYKDMNSGAVIKEDVINGKTFDKIVIDENHEKAIEIEGYVFVKGDTKELKEDQVTITLKYAKKANIVVKHINKYTNKDLAEENIKGYEGKEYSTKEKEELKANYEKVESSSNQSGTMKAGETTVEYYYLKKLEITVNHIDAKTDKKLKSYTDSILAGQEYEYKPENFKGYMLVNNSENIKGKIGEEDLILNFEYGKISSGVLEKHVDINSKAILHSELHEGSEVTDYEIKAKTFEGYDILTKARYYKNNEESLKKDYGEDRINELKSNPENDSIEKLIEALEEDPNGAYVPKNYKGTMKVGENAIEVTYYYIRKTIVTVKYVDIDTNEEIANDDETDSRVTINGYEGDEYETESKIFRKYSLKEEPENKTGKMAITTQEENINNEIVVTYKYILKSAGVKEEHIDINSNKVLYSKQHEGNIRDKYETKAIEIEGYDIVEEELPMNESGIMAEELIEVKYYYIKKSTVRVEYVDKDTGEKLIEDIIIEGHETDYYVAEIKNIEGYELVETSENTTGEMGAAEEVVRYYYKKVKTAEKGEKQTEQNVKTGDTTVIKAIVIIGVIILLNIGITILRKKKRK